MNGPVGAKTGNSLSSATEEKRIQFQSAFFHVAPSMFLAALDQTIIAAVSCFTTFMRRQPLRSNEGGSQQAVEE
jgi:hypothetical protein